MLSEGDIPQAPPVPTFGEAEVRQGEVREQAPIGLASSQSLRCTVCFSRGQEQEAAFAVEGLPAHVKAGASPGAWACLPPFCVNFVLWLVASLCTASTAVAPEWRTQPPTALPACLQT